jgi:hypothetical protein
MSDITDALVNLGTSYISARYAPAAQPAWSSINSPGLGVDYGSSPTSILGIPGGELVGDPGMAAGRHYLRWDKKLQAWVPHKHRRRRRRLLTDTDYDDLLRIGTLPTKDTVKIALSKAIRR